MDPCSHTQNHVLVLHLSGSCYKVEQNNNALTVITHSLTPLHISVQRYNTMTHTYSTDKALENTKSNNNSYHAVKHVNPQVIYPGVDAGEAATLVPLFPWPLLSRTRSVWVGAQRPGGRGRVTNSQHVHS